MASLFQPKLREHATRLFLESKRRNFVWLIVSFFQSVWLIVWLIVSFFLSVWLKHVLFFGCLIKSRLVPISLINQIFWLALHLMNIFKLCVSFRQIIKHPRWVRYASINQTKMRQKLDLFFSETGRTTCKQEYSVREFCRIIINAEILLTNHGKICYFK